MNMWRELERWSKCPEEAKNNFTRGTKLDNWVHSSKLAMDKLQLLQLKLPRTQKIYNLDKELKET